MASWYICHVTQPYMYKNCSFFVRIFVLYPQMTVWSPSIASEDPTSPSSPTLPVGRHKRLSDIPLVPPTPVTPPDCSLKQTGGHSHVLPALSADAIVGCNICNLKLVGFLFLGLFFFFLGFFFFFFLFYKKEKIQHKTKISVVVLCDL